MSKLCVNCSSSEVYEEGIYCNTLNKFVGRCSEQKCLLKDHEEYEAKSFLKWLKDGEE